MRSSLFIALIGGSIAFFPLSSVGQTLFGAKAGGTISWQTNNGAYNVAKAGFEYGLFLRWAIHEKIGIQNEILITQKGYKKSFDKKLFDQLTTQYLEIPLMLSYKLPIKKSFYINIGPYYARWLSGKYASRIDEESRIIKEDYQFKSYYNVDGFKDNRDEFGMVIGIAYPIRQNTLFVDIRFCTGFSGISKWQEEPPGHKKKTNQQVEASLVWSIL